VFGTRSYAITNPEIFHTDWCSLDLPRYDTYVNKPGGDLFLRGDNSIQRRVKNDKNEGELGQAIKQNEALQGELEQEIKQKALLEPTVRYALMPKLDELQERLNDVSNKQEASNAHFGLDMDHTPDETVLEHLERISLGIPELKVAAQSSEDEALRMANEVQDLRAEFGVSRANTDTRLDRLEAQGTEIIDMIAKILAATTHQNAGSVA
jgi:hypothetical protein